MCARARTCVRVCVLACAWSALNDNHVHERVGGDLIEPLDEELLGNVAHLLPVLDTGPHKARFRSTSALESIRWPCLGELLQQL